MGLFVCDKCHAIENTALGWFSTKHKNQSHLGSLYPDGEAYCSECAPAFFASGAPNPKGGKWHGVFPKEIATKEVVISLIKSGSMLYSITKSARMLAGDKLINQQLE